MAEAQLQQFLEKVRQLNAFVALSERDPQLRLELRDCAHHDQVVALARRCGFEIGRRWGEPAAEELPSPLAWDTSPAKTAPAQVDTSPSSEDAAAAASERGAQAGSLLAGPCPPAGEERTQVLLETPLLRLERIHSCAAASPEGFWYEQAEEEWLTLLQGSAGLRFADEDEDRRLRPGDSLLIRAGRRHRVTATDPSPGTVWLALFWRHS